MKYLVLALVFIATPVMAQTVSEKDQQIAELQLQLLAQQLNNLKLKSDVEKAVSDAKVESPVVVESHAVEVIEGVPFVDENVYGAGVNW